jgi:hypothetical protein
MYHFSTVQFAQLSNIHASWAQAKEVQDETCKITGYTPHKIQTKQKFFLMIKCVRIL